MTPNEFKLWFEGYAEALNGLPTEAQWARIKERVAQIGANQALGALRGGVLGQGAAPYPNLVPMYAEAEMKKGVAH
jgi:hypothetical protein